MDIKTAYEILEFWRSLGGDGYLHWDGDNPVFIFSLEISKLEQRIMVYELKQQQLIDYKSGKPRHIDPASLKAKLLDVMTQWKLEEL